MPRPDKPPKVDWEPFNSFEGMVRLVLSVCWDPIGVFGHRNTLDEYDSYVKAVCDLLLAGAGADEIRDHLLSVETQRIGIRRSDTVSLDLTVQKLMQVARWA